jgi:hypothetical protein
VTHRRRRLTDTDVEALMSGHTPPERPDLAATASFLRELPAQLSDSEPIELSAPLRRRTRLFVAAVASLVAVVGLAGVVAMRGGDHVVQPAVGGASPAELVTTTVAGAETVAPPPATTIAPQSGVLTGPLLNLPSDSPAAPTTSVSNANDSPVARYLAAILAWKQCEVAKGPGACGPEPDPAAYGLVPPTTSAPNAAPSTTAEPQPSNQIAPGPASTALQPSNQAGTGSSPCAGPPELPGVPRPGPLTC